MLLYVLSNLEDRILRSKRDTSNIFLSSEIGRARNKVRSDIQPRARLNLLISVVSLPCKVVALDFVVDTCELAQKLDPQVIFPAKLWNDLSLRVVRLKI